MATILIPTLVAAKNIDALNRSFKLDATVANNIDNGFVFADNGLDEPQVRKVAKPTVAKGLWMACEPEDAVVTDAMGNQYRVGALDPRAFTNAAGRVFSGFMPKKGDLITISAEGISGSAADYAVVTADNFQLAFAAAAVEGLSFKVVESTYISVGATRVPAYLLECVEN